MQSGVPSIEPSSSLSSMPSSVPSESPTVMHSGVPSIEPSRSLSSMPSSGPSDSPTVMHSEVPSMEPSMIPSLKPSVEPSKSPEPSGSSAPTAYTDFLLYDQNWTYIQPLDESVVDRDIVGNDLAIKAVVDDAVGRSVKFFFDGVQIEWDFTHYYVVGPSPALSLEFQSASIGFHTVTAQILPENTMISATFEITGGRRRLEFPSSNATVPLLALILRSSFTGASGSVNFRKENSNGRNSEGITVGLFNIKPKQVNPATGNRSYTTTLVSMWNETLGWKDIPDTALVYRDGSTVPTGVFRLIFHNNYISFSARVVGLTLMSIAWLIALMSLALLGWLCKDPTVQRGQPFLMQMLCMGSVVTSTSIFTVSFDEDAGWTNWQLSINCSLTPWFFFSGQILIFGSLFAKLWRVDRALQLQQGAIAVHRALLPLAAFLVTTILILMVQTVYDPWSWERHIIKEMPAETYGKCLSDNAWAFFGPLIGIIFFAELMTLYFAWRTADAPTDYRDSDAIMHACLSQVQAWAVGVPMLAAIGYSSADATYFARIFLIWIFSVASVGVVVLPKIGKALKIRQKPELTASRGRTIVPGLYQPRNSPNENLQQAGSRWGSFHLGIPCSQNSTSTGGKTFF